MTLQGFIYRYTGVAGVGNTPENKGECVGLVQVWDELRGLPHTWGHAKDLLNNADLNAFDVFLNNPTNYPLPGDVLCFNGRWGGGFGHTGVIVSADTNGFTLFEQNNPTGSKPRLVEHPNYSNVQGWMRSKNNQGGEEVNESELADLREWKARATAPGAVIIQQAVIDDLVQWKETGLRLQTVVADLTDQAQAQQKAIDGLTKQIETLQNAPKPAETVPVLQPPTSTTPAAPAVPAAPSESKWANVAKQVRDFFGTTEGRAVLGVAATVVTPVVMALQNFQTDNAVLAAAVLAAVTLLNTVKDALNPNVPNK
ncbi:hypothetical protein QFZ36_000487 [Pseudarthrobacter siccitolerans]|uniref:Peptidase C51 domain-containing protein n=1 Tax=Pseudarthrobacter siccitolerans TaxID=861266 RepID=A0ABU0PG59_9MICC|nr:CHAP domain-containing protein [Pseudarthrobacter siccitolerans]MDQ0672926.1 hypothetical protein [Pseudarthrobacter siccitolerans]